jgi:hypothetical protein
VTAISRRASILTSHRHLLGQQLSFAFEITPCVNQSNHNRLKPDHYRPFGRLPLTTRRATDRTPAQPIFAKDWPISRTSFKILRSPLVPIEPQLTFNFKPCNPFTSNRSNCESTLSPRFSLLSAFRPNVLTGSSAIRLIRFRFPRHDSSIPAVISR